MKKIILDTMCWVLARIFGMGALGILQFLDDFSAVILFVLAIALLIGAFVAGAIIF